AGAGDRAEAVSQESWVSFVGYPPLTSDLEVAAQELLAGLRSSLESVRLVVDDWQAMVSRCEDASNSLDEADWVAEEQVRGARDLLAWLTAGHFIFLGYQEYTFDGQGFTPVAGTGLGVHRGNPSPPSLTGFHAYPVEEPPRIFVMTKHPWRATVHRPAYMDYLGIRSYDPNGRLLGERRFLGLLSTSAYAEAVSNIPVLAAKAQRILEDSGYGPESFGAISIANIISNYPRDELFDADIDELAGIVRAIESLRDRRVVRVFMRRDRYGQFMTNLIYLPRDRYDTATRQRICEILLDTCGGESFEFTARASEAVLAQLFVVVKLRPDAPEYVEDDDVQALIEQATHTWKDDFAAAVAAMEPKQRAVDFGEAYQSTYTVDEAVADLERANTLTDDGGLRYSLTLADSPPGELGVRLKILAKDQLELARIMPLLTSFGVEVIDEKPFEWQLRDESVYLYDIGLRMPLHWEDQWVDVARRLISAFDATYRGLSEADSFNRLVLRADLAWVEVAWLRSIARFIKQVKPQYSQDYIANALLANGQITSLLVRAIRQKFDPDLEFASFADRGAAVQGLLDEALRLIEEVSSLDHDRILRQYVAFVDVSVRFNAFADAATLAWKIDSSRWDLLPDPRPWKEIFVYSPRVQGVHLRFGKVARGGLRWSDRPEDFRTEILGLVKAQTVKNTVIVPVGAKGGFVPAALPDPAAGGAAWLAEGAACYRLFISALLSLSDNIVAGAVVPPQRVLRYDEDDPYLVVAADKGTANFSDTANELSLEHGFWLGDAFASGGSVGYDHKAMGITARGAWESVKWHFAQLGIDIRQPFSCVGIGDMSGDVFGNGMLLSDQIQLVAAFDHRHIFLDPNPDVLASFAQRQRLFGLPRSSWADYDQTKISAGGGVFARNAKQIPISAEVRRVLGLPLEAAALAPDDLVSAILKAPVDLLWNGGIGTYVKAESQSNVDVGDKANDAVRVNGAQVRARVAVEGGNLGWTQHGRIEYALAGGLVNTDFIDNSAGVDTSDFEVNIKILLAGEVAAGRLDERGRRELLASMTDDIAMSVLRHNVAQNAALSNSEARALGMAGRHESWMRELEKT
ncbi:MAG: NAD-glutamate dehydrogenase, partial [Propionibacteriaceae bacterium]|nr:NAD-glutamate dehydrogenase [Propionibacteriaceae bacterium]